MGAGHYLNPSALPGDKPTPETAALAIMAMFRYARYSTRSAPNGERAEEVMRRTFYDIARSRLTEKYQPRPGGVKPYINRMIQRHAWKVNAEALREQEHCKATSLPFDAESRDLDPAKTAELRDLAVRCNQLLTDEIAESHRKKSTKPGSSTAAVWKHRERKEKWQRIAHLFPGVTFRPKRRRK
jgi:hypothetical protein